MSTGFGPNTTKLMDLTLLPISGRQVVVQTEVSQCCYTMCARVMGTQDPDFPDAMVEARDGEALIGKHTKVSLGSFAAALGAELASGAAQEATR